MAVAIAGSGNAQQTKSAPAVSTRRATPVSAKPPAKTKKVAPAKPAGSAAKPAAAMPAHKELGPEDAAAVKPPERTAVESAYLDGEPVAIRFLSLSARSKPLIVGPWEFGKKLSITNVRQRGTRKPSPNRPSDGRLNFYIVVPGKQHHHDEFPEYDNNIVINAMPREKEDREYDVYWAIALDPTLTDDLRVERDLILKAQERFQPDETYEIENAPGAAYLSSALEITSTQVLRERFLRSRDGTLPRIVIAPARFAFRLSADTERALPAPE